MDASNIAVRMSKVFRRFPERPATRIKDGDGWAVRTYAELGRDVATLAGHLVEAGINPGDRVLLLSNNRPEWTIADLAMLSIRAVPVPIYPTSTPEQVRHIAADSGALFAFLENETLLGRLTPVWDELPDLRGAWTFDPTSVDDGRVRTLADVLADPVPAEAEAEVTARLEASSGDDVASIIYTSGTTGEPRGAALTHRGFTFELDALDAFFTITPKDHSLADRKSVV